ncbi:MAG: Ig domain-containing protein [Acidobacteriaceae bacterium]
MLNRLVLPLTIMAFLATAAASNTTKNKPETPVSGSNCLGSAQDAGLISRDYLATSVIGGISSQVTKIRIDAKRVNLPATRNAGPRRGDFYTVAALEMAASPASNASSTPSSCYPALSLGSTIIPSGTVGISYSVTLTANGGQPPYSWSFGQSSLPSGFSINSSGNLTGTPSAAGSYAFNVVVSDSLKNSVTGRLMLNVEGGTSTQPPPTQPPPTQPPPTQPPPTQPPPTQPPPTSPPTGTALTACGDITASGTYYLSQDVSSAGTCFGVDANNITLNLNGHTITYGTAGGSSPTPAIEGHDCWSTDNPADSGPCGSAHGGLEVYGGTIVQSPNSATFSDVFSFGQGTFSTAPYVHDITATFQNTGAQFYNSNYLPPGAKVENNVIYDNVTNINKPGQGDLSARSAFQGQAIYIGQSDDNPGAGDTISGNKIVGSPQGGVRTVNQHSTISGNDVSMNATYSNDFCADVPADYTTVSGNNCHPKSGRGFHVGGLNITLSGNTIAVIELKQNAEYDGCEEGGSYGVQIEDDGTLGLGTNVQVTGNTVTAVAGDCQANGLRLSGLPPTETATLSGNTFTTTNTGGAGQDFAISVDGVDDAGIVIQGNTFNSQYAYVDGGWDSYDNTTVGHNTWLGTPQYTFDAQDGSCALNESGVNVCPSNFTFTDTLPNKVNCGTASSATVTIGGQVTQCKPGQ